MIFLGALVLKMDFIQTLGDLLSSHSHASALAGIIYLSLVVLGISLFVSLASIIASMKVRFYAYGHPDPLVFQLFSPHSEYFDDRNEAGVLRTKAMTLAIAVEVNTCLNSKKGWWIDLSTWSLYFSLVSLAVLLIVLGLLIL
ncbi:hypothetical protein ES703_76067 [subsurface metagenome]